VHAAYLRPAKLEEALEALAAAPRTILAGGTDHYPARVGRDAGEDILDLTALASLKGISRIRDGWRIGATTTWTELIEARLPPLFDALKLAAREVGGIQIQNAGTVAGNLCNASPAADGVPALLALDASAELSSRRGSRILPLQDFITGPRKTARAPDEIVTAVLVPAPRHEARSHFLKLGGRKYLVISIAMVAIVLETERATVRAARIAVGACSPVARRLEALEEALEGWPLDEKLAERALPGHIDASLQPIDDVRASADYRRHAATVLVRRALQTLAAQG
jgi:CO/xanthine dehydrogenase FAD-binding subunit